MQLNVEKNGSEADHFEIKVMFTSGFRMAIFDYLLCASGLLSDKSLLW